VTIGLLRDRHAIRNQASTPEVASEEIRRGLYLRSNSREIALTEPTETDRINLIIKAFFARKTLNQELHRVPPKN